MNHTLLIITAMVLMSALSFTFGYEWRASPIRRARKKRREVLRRLERDYQKSIR